MQYFVSTNLLRTIYFAIFDSTFLTGAGVNFGVKIRMLAQKEIGSIQDKALTIISFKDHNAATGPYHEKYQVF